MTKEERRCPVYHFCLVRRTPPPSPNRERHLETDYCPHRRELQDKISKTGQYSLK